MKKLLLFITFALCLSPYAFPQDYSWQDISNNLPGDPNEFSLSDIYFVSDDEGWITNAWKPEIYHTTDGGESFEIQT